MAFVNRRGTKDSKRQNWIKFSSYFIITNLIIASILFHTLCFYYLAIAISIFGLYEIAKATFTSRRIAVGVVSLLVFLPLAILFIRFARFNQNVLLFTYLVVIIFDAFSQLTGQLFGKTKLVPTISPNKTLEGFIGGVVLASLLGVSFYRLIDASIIKVFLIGMAISLFAFVGDLLASFCKRMFSIKDFSRLLPGQGGILDRFDSLIFSSVIITVLKLYNLI